MHRFFSKPETLLRLHRGPLADYLDRYADWLSEQGFCRAAARLHLLQIADFNLWLDKQGLTLNDIQPAVIDSFIEHGRRRVKAHGERCTLQRFLRLVKPEACTKVSPPLNASHVLLEDFRRHFLEKRGAAPVSYLALQPILHQFLSDCLPGGTVDCARLTAHDVIEFVRRYAYRHSPGRAKLLVTALRVFLRYLRQRGDITSDLAACVPRVAMWPGSTVPKFLSPAQVRQVLAQCDRNSATGIRNYAILTLLSRLGFRADEIVRLTPITSTGRKAASPSAAKADTGLRCLCLPTWEKRLPATFSVGAPILHVAAFSSAMWRPRLVSPTPEPLPP